MTVNSILAIMIGASTYLLIAVLYTAHNLKSHGNPDPPPEILLLEGVLGLMWPLYLLVEIIGHLGKWFYGAIN